MYLALLPFFSLWPLCPSTLFAARRQLDRGKRNRPRPLSAVPLLYRQLRLKVVGLLVITLEIPDRSGGRTTINGGLDAEVEVGRMVPGHTRTTVRDVEPQQAVEGEADDAQVRPKLLIRAPSRRDGLAGRIGDGELERNVLPVQGQLDHVGAA